MVNVVDALDFRVRLNADGSVDPSFPDLAAAYSNAVAIQPDGKILIGGTFSSYDGYSRSRVARLLPDGSVDPAWLGSTTITGGPPEVYSIALQSDPLAVTSASRSSMPDCLS